MTKMKENCESKKVVKRKKRFSSENFGAIIVEGEPNFLPPLAGEHSFRHQTEPLAVLEGVSFNVQSSAEYIDSGMSQTLFVTMDANDLPNGSVSLKHN